MVVVLVVGFFTAAFFAHWFFFAPIATNQQGRIYQGSYGAQTGYIMQAQQLESEVAAIDVQLHSPQTPPSELPSLRSQRQAEVAQACQLIGRIQIAMPTDLQTFAAQNCG